VVVADRRAIVLANRAAQELLGYAAGELLGQSVDVLVPADARAAHAARREGYFADPASRRMGANRDLMARRADGRLVPVEVALQPVASEQGALVVAAIIDLSARKALERQVREANAELERRVRERTAQLEQSNREKLEMLAGLEQARAELERLSRQDPLTGLANRRELDERIGLELQRANRGEHGFCLAMLDIDRFKRVNDEFGHALGDEVLRRIAAVLRQTCRAVDVVARYGGEEFAVALPDTGLAEAVVLCERIRLAIEAHPWHELAVGLGVTISAGVVARLPGESPDAALARADALLYEAKRKGRNRVEAGPRAGI
jgi:diguanylate cyclase (GGDEF)-like protein/PAS domain S-box-containing protein